MKYPFIELRTFKQSLFKQMTNNYYKDDNIAEQPEYIAFLDEYTNMISRDFGQYMNREPYVETNSEYPPTANECEEAENALDEID